MIRKTHLAILGSLLLAMVSSQLTAQQAVTVTSSQRIHPVLIRNPESRLLTIEIQCSEENIQLKEITFDLSGSDDIADLDFIKMDVQGWEMRILEGGAETITRYRPVMVVELVDEQLLQIGDSLQAAWKLLESWGYRAAICIDGKDLTPLEAPRDGDIFWLPD